jgi:hypothetical protein
MNIGRGLMFTGAVTGALFVYDAGQSSAAAKDLHRRPAAAGLLSGQPGCRGENVTTYDTGTVRTHGVCNLNNTGVNLRSGNTVSYRDVVIARMKAAGAHCIKITDAWGSNRAAIADLLCPGDKQYKANFRDPKGCHPGSVDFPGGYPEGRCDKQPKKRHRGSSLENGTSVAVAYKEGGWTVAGNYQVVDAPKGEGVHIRLAGKIVADAQANMVPTAKAA